jgi:coniferyl-aldehyde dehydrogenase
MQSVNPIQRALLQSQLDSMKEKQFREGWEDADVRIDRLRRLLVMLDDQADLFCEALDQDFGGRSKETSLMNDILATVHTIRYARSRVKKWMRPQRRQGVFPFNLFGARVEVRYQPKGVVGIMGTWNVPLFTTLAPLAFAIAAGNRVMLKPSEFVPHTSALLEAQIVKWFDRDEVCVFNGGVDLAVQFSATPFDHLVLTGSARTGRAVMQAASENLVPLTLELGGKSPALIGRSANLGQTTRRLVMGKMMNGGQICVSPDTVYIPNELLEVFLNECVSQHRALFPGDAKDDGLTALINDQHRQRIEGYLRDAQATGARVVQCAEVSDSPKLDRRMPLVLVVNPSPESLIAKEEIFGPLLQVVTYQTLDEVLDRFESGGHPLSLYYFGKDAKEEERVLSRSNSGGVTINDVMMHVAAHDAPFGGVGASGFGCYHGREGFEQFSHARTIYRSGWWDPRESLGLTPPYGKEVYQRLRRTIRM